MADAAQREKRKRSLLTTLIIIGAIIAIALLALPVTSQPSFCGSCHEMKGIYNSWKNSTHQRVTCSNCHIKPGFSNFVAAKLAALQNIYAHVTDIYPHPIRMKNPFSNEGCLQCHSADRVVSPGGDLIIPHQHHVDQLKLTCARCHLNIHEAIIVEGSKVAVKSGALFYHKVCWECHNGVQATNKCTSCHTKKAVPKDHLAADFGATHGELSKTQDCAKCHGYTKDFCIDCHNKRPSSHVLAQNWKGEHGKIAKVNLTNCMACHTGESGYCLRCHD